MLDGLDEEACVEESGHVAEKKRRLSVDQVKALEKNFEVENKLEPERKVKLAQELGLQPRQVAVWFKTAVPAGKPSNWKETMAFSKPITKLLRSILSPSNMTMKLYSKRQIKEMKAKLNEENADSNVSVKEEIILAESDDKASEEPPLLASVSASEIKDLNYESFNSNNNGVLGASLFPDLKDGSSDSDSSAILNEDNSPNPAISSSGILQNHQLMMSPPPATSSFQFTKATAYQTQFVKMEEHNFFSSEEACNFFSDEQAPTLQWYCPDQWN
ncbi:hypothetical protein GH714_017364 [Hevea brasiliensis]|uniref:Homeobox-leucine zipper protein n=1 Tax=Hevea brasiliensis TaxID=3981 RepID=A0A6A6K779_HEVBR|nr:hypothetical protein GH714_017364 [Hevea brasiliensis]